MEEKKEIESNVSLSDPKNKSGVQSEAMSAPPPYGGPHFNEDGILLLEAQEIKARRLINDFIDGEKVDNNQDTEQVYIPNPDIYRQLQEASTIAELNTLISQLNTALKDQFQKRKAEAIGLLNQVKVSGKDYPDKMAYVESQSTELKNCKSTKAINNLITGVKKTEPEIIQAKQLINEIEKLGFGDKDRQMDLYIKQKKMELAQCDTPEKITKFNTTLQDTLTKLSKGGASQLKDTVHNLEEKGRTWWRVINHYGAKAKAQNIINVVSNISVEERFNIKDNYEVKTALAEERHKLFHKTNVDPDKSTTASTVNFKKQLKELKSSAEPRPAPTALLETKPEQSVTSRRPR